MRGLPYHPAQSVEKCAVMLECPVDQLQRYLEIYDIPVVRNRVAKDAMVILVQRMVGTNPNTPKPIPIASLPIPRTKGKCCQDKV
jgi:hypothetical protein